MSRYMVPLGMLVCAAVLAVAGFTAPNQEAFLFPNVVSVIMLIIAAFAVYNSRNPSSRKEKANPIPWLLILPAIAIFIVYLALAETLGFYASSFIAFLVLVCIYMPQRLTVNRFVKVVITDVIFMFALYCLFTLLLKVQLPRGLLF